MNPNKLSEKGLRLLCTTVHGLILSCVLLMIQYGQRHAIAWVTNFLAVSPSELERLHLSTRLNVSDALVSRPLGLQAWDLSILKEK